HCRTTFKAPAGYRIVFKPHNLSLERSHDFLDVFDIQNEKETHRESYSGSYLEGFHTVSRGLELTDTPLLCVLCPWHRRKSRPAKHRILRIR
ncbi:hypothetical protein PFISCL1PPCAC_21717, partial [Pristionchus fissidentatus]